MRSEPRTSVLRTSSEKVGLCARVQHESTSGPARPQGSLAMPDSTACRLERAPAYVHADETAMAETSAARRTEQRTECPDQLRFHGLSTNMDGNLSFSCRTAQNKDVEQASPRGLGPPDSSVRTRFLGCAMPDKGVRAVCSLGRVP